MLVVESDNYFRIVIIRTLLSFLCAFLIFISFPFYYVKTLKLTLQTRSAHRFI